MICLSATSCYDRSLNCHGPPYLFPLALLVYVTVLHAMESWEDIRPLLLLFLPMNVRISSNNIVEYHYYNFMGRFSHFKFTHIGHTSMACISSSC